MRKNRIRQIFAMALLLLVASGLSAQTFQKFYRYNAPQAIGGIFKDVQCLEVPFANNVAIVAVGSDNQVPARGLLAYHDQNGNYVHYIEVSEGNNHPLNAMAICATPTNNLAACFFDPVALATEVISTDVAGTILWRRRLPYFKARGIVSGVDPVTGKEMTWLTGNGIGETQDVVVAAVDNTTGFVSFIKQYNIKGNYSNTIGYGIDYYPTNGNLTIVGKASMPGCLDGLLVMRLDALGGILWSNVYSGPNCAYGMVGKALVKKPGPGAHYGLALEYKGLAGPAASYPGLIHIDNAGNAVGGNYNIGAVPYVGDQFTVDGIDTDGSSYMISGTFNYANAGGVIWGYTLNTNFAGAGIQFNEYANSSIYAPLENRLGGIDYYASHGTYVVGGHFRTSAPAAWPNNPTDAAYWMIEMDPTGASDCPTTGNPVKTILQPNTIPVFFDEVDKDNATSDVTFAYPQAIPFDECAVAKMGSTGSIEIEIQTSNASFAYLEGQGKILADIPSVVQGNLSLSIVDVRGRVLAKFSLPAGEQKIDASALRPGVYMLRYEANGIQSGVQKIAIR